MNKSTLKYIAALSIVCFTLMFCMEKSNSESASITEPQKRLAKTNKNPGKLSNFQTSAINDMIQNISSQRLKTNLLNGFKEKKGRMLHKSMVSGKVMIDDICIPIDYACFPQTETHSVSGNLFGEMAGDSLKNRNNGSLNCIDKYENDMALIIAEYFVKIPSSSTPNNSTMICRLFEDGKEVFSTVELFSIQLDIIDDTLQHFQAFDSEILEMKNFIFCETNKDGKFTGNLYAKVFARIEHEPKLNNDGSHKNYELFFAVVEEHSPNTLHHINAHVSEDENIEKISENKIASLSEIPLDELRDLNNQDNHLADHIEFISFTICETALSFPPPIIGKKYSLLNFNQIAN
ncbi:MAG: hypothetical protein HKO66_06355 [Saprospiraceae bacterium]|nr:hypothetical protein [Bacteroidia bacterium]NNL91833.1 hypothetical protein [Saprospiraceae bacterium]